MNSLMKETFCKISFLITGLEVGEKIPFPVLKINFELLGEKEKYFVKEVFDQRP